MLNRGVAIFLCDLTGTMAEPWVAAGYSVILVDPQHPEGVHTEGAITRVGHVIDHPETWRVLREVIISGRVVFVAGFPPCTDVAVSGALWWAGKAEKDRYFQCKATRVAEQCKAIGELSGAPWMFENPKSAFGGIFGKPQHKFDPWHFTALAPEDNYTKETWLWSGNGFQMPGHCVLPEVARAVALVKLTAGRMVPKRKALELLPDDALVADWYPDNRIHQCPPGPERANIRSATPLGFSRASFRVNAPQPTPQLEAVPC